MSQHQVSILRTQLHFSTHNLAYVERQLAALEQRHSWARGIIITLAFLLVVTLVSLWPR